MVGDLRVHGGDPDDLLGVCVDIFPAFVEGVAEHLANAVGAFVKCYFIAHALHALDPTCWAKQKRDPDLQGLRSARWDDRTCLSDNFRAALTALLRRLTIKRTARSCQYWEVLGEIFSRKQILSYGPCSGNSVRTRCAWRSTRCSRPLG